MSDAIPPQGPAVPQAPAPRTVYVEWVPYKLEIRRPTPPSGGSWEQLDTYGRHLVKLGMLDPTECTARRVAAEQLRNEAERYSAATTKDDNMAGRLAAGELSARDAAKLYAKSVDVSEAQATATKVRLGLEAQCRELLRFAVGAVHEHPWLEVLRPIAAKAIEQRDQLTWDRVHGFAAWLRDPAVGVCALSAAMANPSQDGDPWLYQFGDAGRGLYLWRVNADGTQAMPGTSLALPDGGWRTTFALRRTAPFPSIEVIAEHADAWRPGLFSAEEVIANQERTLSEQDAELDALMGGQTPAKSRRAVTEFS